MRSAVIHRHGGPDVIQIIDVPHPQPVFTEVRVEVHAAAINPIDVKTRMGRGVSSIVGPPPFPLGWDVAGVVDKAPLGTQRIAVGDRVFGLPRFPRAAGTFAETTVGPARHFAKIPDAMDFVTAAAIPLAGLTAWQLVHDVAQAQAGQRILIHAAAGGVGHLATQIAIAAGASVVGTASEGDADQVRDYGAEHIDYRGRPFEQQVKDVDIVLDLVGGDVGYRSLETLRPDGLIVSVPTGQPPGLDRAAADRGLRSASMVVEPDHSGLESLVRLWNRGELVVQVSTVHEFDDIVAAHRAFDDRQQPGKVVITMR